MDGNACEALDIDKKITNAYIHCEQDVWIGSSEKSSKP